MELKYLCASIASATVNFTANMKTPSFITNRIKNKWNAYCSKVLVWSHLSQIHFQSSQVYLYWKIQRTNNIQPNIAE